MLGSCKESALVAIDSCSLLFPPSFPFVIFHPVLRVFTWVAYLLKDEVVVVEVIDDVLDDLDNLPVLCVIVASPLLLLLLDMIAPISIVDCCVSKSTNDE